MLDIVYIILNDIDLAFKIRLTVFPVHNTPTECPFSGSVYCP